MTTAGLMASCAPRNVSSCHAPTRFGYSSICRAKIAPTVRINFVRSAADIQALSGDSVHSRPNIYPQMMQLKWRDRKRAHYFLLALAYSFGRPRTDEHEI